MPHHICTYIHTYMKWNLAAAKSCLHIYAFFWLPCLICALYLCTFVCLFYFSLTTKIRISFHANIRWKSLCGFVCSVKVCLRKAWLFRSNNQSAEVNSQAHTQNVLYVCVFIYGITLEAERPTAVVDLYGKAKAPWSIRL